jgi:hypothetical protein
MRNACSATSLVEARDELSAHAAREHAAGDDERDRRRDHRSAMA